MTLLEFPAAAAGAWIIAPGADFITFHQMSIDVSIRRDAQERAEAF